MATSEASVNQRPEPAPAPHTAPSGFHLRKVLSLVGQYTLLTVLAIIIVAPLLLTVRQALAPTGKWVVAGVPWHPTDIEWKDRTFFSGGAVSALLRTVSVAAVLGWIVKSYSGLTTKKWLTKHSAAASIAVVGATLATALTTSPVFRSFHAADGRTTSLFVLAGVVVSLVLTPALWLVSRRPVGAVITGIVCGFLVVGVTVLAFGPVVWTQSWASNNLGGGMTRSLIMTILITVAQVLTSIIAAYAFVYLEFPFKRLIFGLFMATLLLPLEVTLAANIATVQRMGWFNTYQGLVLPFAASAIGTFLIHQGFRGVPKDLRDAARLDGYGHMQYLFRVAVPLTRPVIAAFTVISALSAWNQYLWPRSVIDDPKFDTLQLQLRGVVNDPANLNVGVAAALVAAVPVLILLIAFQRQIVRGLTAGAVK